MLLALQLTETWPLWLVLPVAALLAWALGKTLTDRAPAKRYASFALRLLAAVLLILAVARPTLDRDTDRFHAVFVVDLSASVDLADARAALDDIDAALDNLQPGDTHALFTVGSGLRRHATPQDIAQTLDRWDTGATDDRLRAGTDLAAALTAARLTAPDDAATRVVLFTDARPTTGPLSEALAQLQTQGVGVQHRPLASLTHPEIAVSALTASPAFAHEGEPVRLSATVAGNRSGPAQVRIVHRGVIVARREVTLVAGEPQRVDISVPMLTPGRTVWTAQVAPVAPAAAPPQDTGSTGPAAPDHFTINNAVSTTVHVTGRPRVLVLHEKNRDLRAFAAAMERQDLVVEVRPAAGAPRRMDELLAFDAVVLSDVPATDLSAPQLDLFKRYVADFGGGLAMFGGENSFGLGGYYRTPVEEVLPLSSRFEQEKEKPSMAMVLVIDKSGSMQGQPIALARQAAKAAIELLSPRDQIGVVGFDGQAFVALPMTSASDREGAKSAVDRIGAGGGTFMFAGMDAARQMLDNTPARIKHMIVLGDGQSQPADHDGLTRDLADTGVTVSTVALGGGADQALMARIAEIGRGRYYLTMDPSSVPTRETMQASRSAIKEDLFSAIQTGEHPLLAGYTNTELPFTLGYVMTRARPTAQVLLTTDTGDPLLAINPYGLGQGLAFTGDLTERWGGEWLAWPGFGKFWSQALRALVRRPNQSPLGVTTTAGADALRIEITEPGAARSAAPPTAWQAQSLDDTGRSHRVPVRPVGVGRYLIDVPLGKSQRVTVRLHDPQGSQLRTVQHDRPYPAEYLLNATPDPALTAAEPFTPTGLRLGLVPATTALSLTPWLLLLSILSFTAGVLLRRL